MAEVVKLHLVDVGEAYRSDPDDILELAKGEGYETVVVLGDKDGMISVVGNANTGEALILMERAKHLLVFADD